MTVLDDLQQSISTVAAKAGPSVVGVGHRWRGGSGVVIADGRVLTNAHNIHDETVTVTFDGQREVEGRLVGIDHDADLAVVSVDTGSAAAVAWETAGAASVGSVVFGVARPGGRLRVTFGTVSSVERSFRGPGGRRISGAVEHTVPLAPGSSGGPIVDANGRFVGLNTNRVGEGFYLALPADEDLRRRVDALGRGEAPARPRLGIAVAPAEVARRLRRSVGLPERDGLLVREVETGSPAERAGIHEGDLIVEVAGQQVTDVDALHELLGGLAAGASFELRLLRGIEERSVTVDTSPTGGAGGATAEA